jgi:peptidyl-prolyl cis-trans isomerase C
MRTRKYLLPLLALGLAVAPAAAQTGSDAPPPAPAPVPVPSATGVAAKVNGQDIPETAVQRWLRLQRVPPARHAEARPTALDFFIEKALVDQYLAQLKVEPDKKEVESRIEKIETEIKKDNKKVEDVLKDLLLTEAEFRTEIEADARWDRFANDQATDEKLKKYFEANRETFDGTQVHARHILIAPATPDAKAAEGVVAKLRDLKKQAEQAGKAAVEALPPNADAFTKKKTYNEAVEKAFADQARQCSICPSKAVGGDVGWFERTHGMVEPFAKAAFALEPYQMSDVVKTQFGYHLILVTERRPGHEVKFEDVKPLVKEVYSDRLREAVIAAMRPRAKIEITPATKSGE